MTRLDWNQPGQRFYESGVDRGVLYPELGDGVAWPGIAAISEKSVGGEILPLYYDGVKYYDFVAAEDFAATLEAFQAPREFSRADGVYELLPGLFATQQPRQTFGLSFRTLIGNDLQDLGYAYKLHLVYGCTAAPSDRTYASLQDRADAPTRTWEISCVPQPAATYKPTSHFVFDSRDISEAILSDIEDALYGTFGTQPRLPSQAEIITMATP